MIVVTLSGMFGLPMLGARDPRRSLTTAEKAKWWPEFTPPPAGDARAEEKKRAQEAENRVLEELGAMTAGERERALRRRCALGCTPDDAAVRAAATEEERKQLAALAARLDAANQAKREAAARAQEAAQNEAAREQFAALYDRALLDNHMNPDGVDATGPGKTTLRVRGWFCTRQFMDDFRRTTAATATAAGFKRVECTSSFEHWWADL